MESVRKVCGKCAENVKSYEKCVESVRKVCGKCAESVRTDRKENQNLAENIFSILTYT